MIVAPSILAGDLADLAGAARTASEAGADLLHLDVMDGRFVPNLTFGAPVVRAIARHTELPLDLHLMVESPGLLLDDYLAAEPAQVAVHQEATRHLDRVLARIRQSGARAGVALNPTTPVDSLVDALPALDFVVLMSVNPGFAGQPFLPYVVDKARRLRGLIDRAGASVQIEMDGGVDPDNVAAIAAAGVEIVVAGSAVYGADDPAAVVRALRAAGQEDS